MSPEAKAEWARQALDNPVVKDALKAIKDEIYAKFCETAPADTQAREHYHRLHEAAAMFERLMNGYIASGQLESLQQEQTLKEKVKRLWA
jgi:hypothetical protein